MNGISDAVQEATVWMDEIEGVQGVGEGKPSDGRLCVNVYVVSKTIVDERTIPKDVNGYPVCVIDSGGEFQIQPTSRHP